MHRRTTTHGRPPADRRPSAAGHAQRRHVRGEVTPRQYVELVRYRPARGPITASCAAICTALVPAPSFHAERDEANDSIAGFAVSEPDAATVGEAGERIGALHGGRAAKVPDPFGGGGAIPSGAASALRRCRNSSAPVPSRTPPAPPPRAAITRMCVGICSPGTPAMLCTRPWKTSDPYSNWAVTPPMCGPHTGRLRPC